MRALLAERTGAYVPTMSEFERRTCELLGRRGIAPPVRQHPVALAGTTVRLDLAWPDVLVAVECDGLFHHGHNQQLPWDEHRQNELVLLGWLVLRFTWRQLVDAPDHLVRQVRAALDARTLARPA
jgi:very-short-patch-repair endonuclease